MLNKNWEMYFTSYRPITTILGSSELKVKRINGGLHKIWPTENFTGFKSHIAKTI